MFMIGVICQGLSQRNNLAYDEMDQNNLLMEFALYTVLFLCISKICLCLNAKYGS